APRPRGEISQHRHSTAVSGTSTPSPSSDTKFSAERRSLGRKVHTDIEAFTRTGQAPFSLRERNPSHLTSRDLGLSDLGLCSRIMIVKVPGALWTVAFQ